MVYTGAYTMKVNLIIHDFDKIHDAAVDVEEFALIRDPMSPCGLSVELVNHIGSVTLQLNTFQEIRYNRNQLSLQHSFHRYNAQTINKLNKIFDLNLGHPGA
jgi:hypothetical protein